MKSKAKKFLKLIKSYQKIIITRHKNPDFDAIGSQVGLWYVIKDNFPKKEVFVVGDTNRFDYENLMTELKPEDYKDALLIITDVSVSNLLPNDYYKYAKDVIIIDHHENDCNIENATLIISDTSSEAAALLTYEIVDYLKLKVSKKASQYFLSGIITDTGRFQYVKNAKRLFENATKLTKLGADPKKLYLWLYREPLSERILKNQILNKIIYEDNIAYFILDDNEIKTKYQNEDFFTLSRGTVNLMSGIDEVEIWANFVYSPTTNDYKCEFRSRTIQIVDIAKKYGGGGHSLACGASIKDKTKIKEIIKDLKERAKKKESW